MEIAHHLVSAHAESYYQTTLYGNCKLKLLKLQKTIKVVQYHQVQILYFRATFFSLALNKMVCLLTVMQVQMRTISASG